MRSPPEQSALAMKLELRAEIGIEAVAIGLRHFDGVQQAILA
jgi:hypothetical protein